MQHNDQILTRAEMASNFLLSIIYICSLIRAIIAAFILRRRGTNAEGSEISIFIEDPEIHNCMATQ